MVFRRWQVGLHIQQDKVVIVALQRNRAHWRLCRWWRIPLELRTVNNGQIVQPAALVSALCDWRKSLPRQHDVYLSFPAERTLQKTLPEPAIVLRGSRQEQWITHAMGHALEMVPDTLCVDYMEDNAGRCCHVTAAQHQDIMQLRTLAVELNLQVAAIVPDACALQHFLPRLKAPARGLAWSDGDRWLWATEQGWGCCTRQDAPTLAQLVTRLNLREEEMIACHSFDPWEIIARLQPPLPHTAEEFAIAIGLALGETS